MIVIMLYRVEAKKGKYKGIQFEATPTNERHVAIVEQIGFLQSAMDAGLELQPSRMEVVVGGLPIDVVEADNGWLEVHEADYQSTPIRTVRGFDRSLTLLAERSRLAERFGIEDHDEPDVTRTCTACTRWNTASRISARREKPIETNPRDSGWVIDCLDTDHDHDDVRNLRLINVYELVVELPRLFAALSFPIGTEVMLIRGEIENVIVK